MNTTMWRHPATQRNVEKLRNDGVRIIEPDAGEMACGTIGPGRLSEPDRIVASALEILASNEPRIVSNAQPAIHNNNELNGERILITAGATREPIDPVRFISNRSSGRMGFALAEAARRRGANVVVVAGVTNVEPTAGVELIRVTSAEEMRDAVLDQIESATAFIAAAAVADYRPNQPASTKIKKSESTLSLELERTPDILREVAQLKRAGQLILGFAAETNDLLSNARAKMTSKNLDMIIANDVSGEGIGFESENNAVMILVRDGSEPIELRVMSKAEIADRIVDELVKLRHRNVVAKSA